MGNSKDGASAAGGAVPMGKQLCGSLSLVPADVDGDHVLQAEVKHGVRLAQGGHQPRVGGVHVQWHLPAVLLR